MTAIAQIVQQLGLTPAPLVLAGVREADTFFRMHLHVDPLAWLDYLRGIDFHKPVHQVWLPRNARLIRHAPVGLSRPKPFSYFADPGASPTRTGTTFGATIFEDYDVPHPVLALESFAASLSFGLDPSARRFDPVARAGGARQYILADRDARSLRQVR